MRLTSSSVRVLQVFDAGLIGEGILHILLWAKKALLHPDATLVSTSRTNASAWYSCIKAAFLSSHVGFISKPCHAPLSPLRVGMAVCKYHRFDGFWTVDSGKFMWVRMHSVDLCVGAGPYGCYSLGHAFAVLIQWKQGKSCRMSCTVAVVSKLRSHWAVPKLVGL